MSSGANPAAPATNVFSASSARHPRPALRNSCTSAAEQQERVRSVLNTLPQRQAEFLVLRSHGFSYDEIALTLNLNPSSIGTLLSRAQQSFREEFIQRYGHE